MNKQKNKTIPPKTKQKQKHKKPTSVELCLKEEPIQ